MKSGAETDREEVRAAGLAVLLAAAALLPRLVWVTLVPTRPVSDFDALVKFAVAFTHSPIARGAIWQQFNPGLPLLLSAVLRVFPAAAPEVVARYATAAWTGGAALAPFLLWRGVLGLRARLAAALGLALWPGHVFFSGVVAQDNWVLTPLVFLVCLAVRVQLRREGGFPIASAVLFGLCVSIRQEMLVAAAIPALVAAGALSSGRRAARLLALGAVSGAILFGLAFLRERATGRLTLSTDYAPLSVLGTVVPEARLDWVSPRPHVEAAWPRVLRPGEKIPPDGLRVAARLALARPLFHAMRMLALLVEPQIRSDPADLWWSMADPGALPPGAVPWRGRFLRIVRWPLVAASAALLGLFTAALLLGRTSRSAAIRVAASAVLIKLAIHVVLVSPQARYSVPVTALEILVVAVALDAVLSEGLRRRAALALGGSALLLFALLAAGRGARAWVLSHQEQPDYRFSLSAKGGSSRLDCTMSRGFLAGLTRDSAEIEFREFHPRPGETAEAACTLAAERAAAPLSLEVAGGDSPGFPGSVFQEVEIGGKEALRQDLCSSRPTAILPVPSGGGGQPAEIRFALVAADPDPSVQWGLAARMKVRLVAAPAPLDRRSTGRVP